MKKFLLVFTIGAMALASCGDDKKDEEGGEEEGGEESRTEAAADTDLVADAVANDKIDMSIKGMKCSKGCVGSVEKCLAKVPGVVEFEVDFDKEEEVDHALIAFDNTVTSPEEMKEHIESLNDGAYEVVDYQAVAGSEE